MVRNASKKSETITFRGLFGPDHPVSVKGELLVLLIRYKISASILVDTVSNSYAIIIWNSLTREGSLQNRVSMKDPAGPVKTYHVTCIVECIMLLSRSVFPVKLCCLIKTSKK